MLHIYLDADSGNFSISFRGALIIKLSKGDINLGLGILFPLGNLYIK
jgi:hypothetical protein